jgi:hypothetical protein
MDRAAPWKRHAAARPNGWHVIAEIDLAAMLVRHAEQRRLCASLETLADTLPALPNDGDGAVLGQRLLAFANAAPADETTFARLDLARGEGQAIVAAISRWRLLDALHAQDLADLLAGRDEGEAAREIDRLAYMLRCFFEGCRRSITLAEMAILMLGGRRLTQAAAASVRASLARA